MAYWIFQANPNYSRILEAIRDRTQIYWLVTRYVNQIANGDDVLIWIAGKQAGIYAIAQVMATPQFFDQPPDLEIWTTPIRARGQYYVPVQLVHKQLEQPLLKFDLKQDAVLRNLEVIRFPHHTNFRLTVHQWERVVEGLNNP